MVPPYLMELSTEYFYFTHSTAYFFFLSSQRLYFYIIYIGAVSVLVGRHSSNLRLTWASYAASILGLFLLLYVGCNPRACYNQGIDGLEPLRSCSFFLAEGIALSAVGFSTGNRLSWTDSMVWNSAAFYAIAFYPVIYTVAGVRIVAQVSPLPVLGLVACLSFATSIRAFEKRSDWKAGLIIPIVTFLALSAVSIGIAAQYLQQVVPVIGTLFACVVVGCLLGLLNPVGGRKAVRRIAKSRTLTAALVGFVLFSMVVMPLDAVNGTAPNLATNSYGFVTPVLAGGFNSGPNLATAGVSANFSFQGTDPSSIQTNNYLAAGIGIHSPNCCVDGIDYGYRADVYLYHNATEVFAASAWEVCDMILACGGHTWKHLMFFSSSPIDSSIESSFQLSIMWKNRTASWFYSSNSGPRLEASFLAPKQENPAFDSGWLGPSSTPSPGGWPFFQFEVMSAFPIGHPGWRVAVGCPSIILSLGWACIDHAELLQGDASYWKALWRWGESYPNVGATVNPEAKMMTFQYSQTTFRDFQTAW